MRNFLAIAKDDIKKVQSKFESRCSDNSLDYFKEASFAYQMIAGSSQLKKAAMSNRASLQAAIINVANVGITLNPAHTLAYLVPRNGKVCLDLSYRGLILVATNSGYIRHAAADVVKRGDKFIFKGVLDKPEHIIEDVFNTDCPHSEKETVGAYCVAKMPDGSFMAERLDSAEIKLRKSLSPGSSSSYSPWKNHTDAMIKKSVVRKASKTWISSDLFSKLEMAGVLDDNDIEVKRDNASRISDIIDGNIETHEVDDNMGWDDFEKEIEEK